MAANEPRFLYALSLLRCKPLAVNAPEELNHRIQSKLIGFEVHERFLFLKKPCELQGRLRDDPNCPRLDLPDRMIEWALIAQIGHDTGVLAAAPPDNRGTRVDTDHAILCEIADIRLDRRSSTAIGTSDFEFAAGAARFPSVSPP